MPGMANDFNPLPPCGGRQQHFLREKRLEHFNPLPPCGGRPDTGQISNTSAGISIHSLRVEGDNDSDTVPYFVVYFNPLPPCGGRHTMYNTGATLQHFNPLPPCGGRHLHGAPSAQSNPISIHSLRVEGDKIQHTSSPPKRISIHSLRVEGDVFTSSYVWRSEISIHSLRVEGDCPAWRLSLPFRISIHSLRVEGDVKTPHLL